MGDIDKNQAKKALDKGEPAKSGGTADAGRAYGPLVADIQALGRRDREVLVRAVRNVRNRVSAKEAVGCLRGLALILVFILWNFLTYSTPMPNSLGMLLCILLAILVLLVGTPTHSLFPAMWARYHQLEDEWSALAQEWAGHAPGRSVEQFPAASEEFRELTRQTRNKLFA